MDAEDSFSIPPMKKKILTLKILLKIPPVQNGKHGISINLITREVKVYCY